MMELNQDVLHELGSEIRFLRVILLTVTNRILFVRNTITANSKASKKLHGP